MAYTSFSKLSLYWLGYNPRELRENRRRGLGGVISEKASELPSTTLENTLTEVGEKDPKASREVATFFRDYLEVLKELHRVLKRGGYACIVIGNRNVRGVPVLNDKITVELGEAADLRREEIIYRNIPRKVLPRSDGRIELINRESIVILKNE
jgi:site-specific DNA-methyltransferase (cytosine-N4-specific)